MVRQKAFQLFIVAMALVCAMVVGCTLGGEDTKRLPELQGIAANTPTFPGFVHIDSLHIGKPQKAVLTNFYRSSASYDDVKRFYISNLTGKGWSYPSEEVVPKWFVNDGSKALTFRKGEYSIDVEYNADKNSNWQFAVDYGWETK